MNTPSHFIMTAALERASPRASIAKWAFLIGSVAPDLPLWLLSIGGMMYYQYILGWSKADTFRIMFDHLYFENPVWITLHNLCHAPLILLAGLALVWRKRRNLNSWQHWWFWFLIACFFHSAVDILTHADDGPLLLFPFSWSLRFNSPISYWDPRHHGTEFQTFELTLDITLLIYLLKPQINQSVRRIIKKLR
ncbi:MAG TPA: metal-dependent hydrolase [Crinalium sp.]|jgi:membrane-bound metal-dependent hydrolase YbcI (DUF457 family)